MTFNSLRKLLESVTGQYASLIALGVFTLVSITATGMGFLDLRLANADRLTPDLKDHLTTWPMTIGVVLAMIAALNLFLGVGVEGKSAVKRGLARGLAAIFYLFFAIWSVGFGYGFFWKELAGEEYTRTQFQTAIESVATSVALSEDTLANVETIVGSVATTARARAEQEASQGGTCANRPDSLPGDGPLTRARFAFADRAEAVRQDVALTWTSKLATDRKILNTRLDTMTSREAPLAHLASSADESRLLEDLANVASLDMATREKRFAVVFDDAKAFIRQANGLKQTQAPFFADRLDQLAVQVGPSPDDPGQADTARKDDPGYCWDVVLYEKLSSTALALRSLERLPAPEFEFTEGPRATRAAFFNLTATLLSPVIGASASFGPRELLALFSSIAVDLGIFFMSLVRAWTSVGAVARRPRDPEYLDLNPIKSLARKRS